MNDDAMKRLVFTGKQLVELEEAPVQAPGDEQVLIRTRYSLMSKGTENIYSHRGVQSFPLDLSEEG